VTTRRRIRTRRVLGEGRDEKEELIVECPDHEHGAAFQECLSCSRFEGYVLSPHGRGSFVSCDGPSGLSRVARDHGCSSRIPVTAVMSDPVCVREDATLDELARVFVERKIGGLPVVDAGRRPIGVVAKTDLIEALAGHMVSEPRPSRRRKKPRRGFQEERPSSLTAHELMTPVVHSIPDTATLTDAAALMAEKGVHRLPVLSRSGEVTGVVTALDIVRHVGARRTKELLS
jgi:CBS domain-containing protein